MASGKKFILELSFSPNEFTPQSFLILRSFVFLSVFCNTHKAVDAKEENFI